LYQKRKIRVFLMDWGFAMLYPCNKITPTCAKKEKKKGVFLKD